MAGHVDRLTLPTMAGHVGRLALPTTALSDAEVNRLIEERDPSLWRFCYPRIYEEPRRCGAYHSPKSLARQVWSVISRIDAGYVGQSEMTEAIWASVLAQHRFPLYWVTRDLALAVQQTIPPVTLTWDELKMPFDGMTFMLPRGFLLHSTPGEGDAMFVSVTRTYRDREYVNVARSGPRRLSYDDDGLMFVAATVGDRLMGGHLMHWNCPRRAFPEFDLQALDQLAREFNDPRWEHTSGYPNAPHMDDADNQFMQRVAHLVFGLLLLMVRKPELVQPANKLRTVKAKSSNLPREFWAPAIIGRDFKLRRVYTPQGGTHASPRGHWVRGFWRDQAYGPGLTLRKDHWVKPYWRGGDSLHES